MKKSIIIGVSILSIFILCSLSYQPITADTPIEPISMAKKSKASDLDVDELKELYIKLLELKSQSDCGCGDTEDISDSTICGILVLLSLPFLALFYLFASISNFGIIIDSELWYYFWLYVAIFLGFPAVILWMIWIDLGCSPWPPWPCI